MPEQPTPPPTDLRELARLLRRTHHLGPEAQQALADLVEELARTLPSASLPAEEKTHLAETTAHLVHALHQRHDEGLLEAAQHRLKEAATRVEMRAPVATGIIRRLIETLADFGI